MTITLKELVNVESFSRMIREGYISERSHELSSELRVYSYTPKTQYSGLWTDETRLARGLLLKLQSDELTDALVVGRGLPKFFTVEQSDSDWAKPKLVDDDENVTVAEDVELPWQAPAFVANKLNGALGLAYEAPDGLAIATKGSFGSLEARIATRLLRDKLSLAQQRELLARTENTTVLFEIITPERPHPVDYGELEDVILLGHVEHESGRWHPATPESSLARTFGFTVAERLKLENLREAVRAPYRENTEGLVVTVNDGESQQLYKVKPQEYLELRKAFYATETFDMATLLLSLESEKLEHLSAELIPLPQGLRNAELQRQKISEELLLPLREELKSVRELYRQLRGDGALPERADFAAAIKSSPLASAASAWLFMVYNEESTGKSLLASALLKSMLKRMKRQSS